MPAMTLRERIPAAVAAFLAATKWSPRRLSVEAGLGQGFVARLTGGCGCTLASADAILRVILTHAPDNPEGRRARALADLRQPPALAQGSLERAA